MIVDVLVESEDSPLDVRSLAGWLADHDDLRVASVLVVGAAADDEMGVVDEVVRVVSLRVVWPWQWRPRSADGR